MVGRVDWINRHYGIAQTLRLMGAEAIVVYSRRKQAPNELFNYSVCGHTEWMRVCSAGLGPNPAHVLQIADVQSTSLFVHDALCLSELAAILNLSSVSALLLGRARQMRAQLPKLWDPDERFFADRYVLTGEFSRKLTPTAVYPLLAGYTSVSLAQARATVGHLMNASELCVSKSFDTDKGNSQCYWGLPSVSKADISYMEPQSYIYWRGNTWGPMTMLTYWSLTEFAQSSDEASAIVAPAIEALVTQKEAQLLWHWRAHRHICENYSPYSPASTTPPGNSQVNTECTGWQFYNWGALNGVPKLLEQQSVARIHTVRHVE